MVIIIRPATAADAPTILSMMVREGLDPSTRDWRNFIVAVDDAKADAQSDEIVGMAQIKPYTDCHEFGSLTVRPSHREQGIGGRLVRALVEKEPGDVWLLCRDTRVPYYTKFGFAPMDHRDAPKTLQRKLRIARLFGVFGVKVVCMRLSPSRHLRKADRLKNGR
jgi:N-acetylglutamate synthase-like GNAT family acetyltransferase